MKKKTTQLAKVESQTLEFDPEAVKASKFDSRMLAGGSLYFREFYPMNYARSVALEKPQQTNFPMIFMRALYYSQESEFLNTFLPFKRSILNYGFNLRPVEKSQKNDAVLKSWMAEEVPSPVEVYTDPQTGLEVHTESTKDNNEMVNSFVENVWDEINLFDNCSSMWLDGRDYALTLPLDRCIYRDIFGVEYLNYTHSLSRQQIETYLPKEEQARYFQRPWIILDPAHGEHFKVFKRTPLGAGFGPPRIYSIFRLLAECESKAVGQHAMAFALRTVKRMHKLGHEVRGPNAGKLIPHTMWSVKRSDNVKRLWVDAPGFDEYTANWDEEITFPWPDLKVFDDVLWKGSNARFTAWAGPIGQMMVAKGANDYLANTIKAFCEEERRKVGIYLSAVINRAFNPPIKVECAWSDTIFNPARLGAEMMKFASMQGLASAKTTRKEIGLDDEYESSRKVDEANDPQAKKKYTPIWDQSHGVSPAIGENLLKLTPDAGGGEGGGDGGGDEGGGATPRVKRGKGKGPGLGSKNGRPNAMGGPQDNTSPQQSVPIPGAVTNVEAQPRF